MPMAEKHNRVLYSELSPTCSSSATLLQVPQILCTDRRKHLDRTLARFRGSRDGGTTLGRPLRARSRPGFYGECARPLGAGRRVGQRAEHGLATCSCVLPRVRDRFSFAKGSHAHPINNAIRLDPITSVIGNILPRCTHITGRKGLALCPSTGGLGLGQAFGLKPEGVRAAWLASWRPAKCVLVALSPLSIGRAARLLLVCKRLDLLQARI
ncbi:hypothetical protein C8F01DRAFT_750158 [Mycena amicta]|nr:hypothetical protein C8F01DRAFT_750158 [Mycena amicta]